MSETQQSELFGHLDSNAKQGGKEISHVLNEDDEHEIIGYLTSISTGEALVPRSWLIEQFREKGVHQTYLPNDISDYQAYGRAMNMLLDEVEDEFEMKLQDGTEVEVSLRMEDGDGTYINIIYADIHFSEEDVGVEGGKHNTVRLGHFDLMQDELTSGVVSNIDIDKNHPLYDTWKNLYTTARELFDKLQTHHNGYDLQNVIDSIKGDDNIHPVRYRRGMYFFPYHVGGTLEKLAKIWSLIDMEFKQHNKKTENMEIITIPVINTENQREIINDRVEQKLEKSVDEAIETIINRIEDDTTEEVAEAVVGQFDEMLDVTEQYNAILEAEISAESVFQEKMNELSEQKEDVVQDVLSDDMFQ